MAGQKHLVDPAMPTWAASQLKKGMEDRLTISALLALFYRVSVNVAGKFSTQLMRPTPLSADAPPDQSLPF